MTNEQLIRRIAEVWPPWTARDFGHAPLPYVLMGELAYDIDQAVCFGEHLSAVPAVFAAVEEALALRDPELGNLVAVGLFEPLQNHAVFGFEPPDVIDQYLGQRSTRLWRDLIEGYAAPGIRSIAAWRAMRDDA